MPSSPREGLSSCHYDRGAVHDPIDALPIPGMIVDHHASGFRSRCPTSHGSQTGILTGVPNLPASRESHTIFNATTIEWSARGQGGRLCGGMYGKQGQSARRKISHRLLVYKASFGFRDLDGLLLGTQFILPQHIAYVNFNVYIESSDYEVRNQKARNEYLDTTFTASRFVFLPRCEGRKVRGLPTFHERFFPMPMGMTSTSLKPRASILRILETRSSCILWISAVLQVV